LTGVEERLHRGHLLNLTAGSLPVTAGEPAIPGGNETAGQGENVTEVVLDYDDDELADLVEENSASLMLLSVQNTYALYAWDETPARESAAALRTLATGLLTDSARLEVSSDREDLKTSFTLALESYATVGETLQKNNLINRTTVDTALEANRQGSNYLREAFEDLQRPVLEVPEEIVAVSFSLPRSYTGSTPGEELVLLQRYVYEDRNRANDISLMLESASSTSTYYLLDGSSEAVVAEPGRTFLLVKVKATNLGHKGENRVYSIRTPDLGSFTLYYRETTYAPVKLASRTSLGEPYAAATLNRYGVKTGYIVFDVPATLSLDECSVRVNLGSDASPVWALGKTL
ncbi:MAG: DUF4352 domain-containing protein, partial [Methanoculleus sp.]|nr:DUF4352 domain-containing protein [Methanoculleus sp.]